MKKKGMLITTVSPHIREGSRTPVIMWLISLCLVPAGMWGVYLFGTGSLLIIAVCIGVAVVTELVIKALSRKFTIMDGSAFLTGLLIGYTMPPTIPLYVPAIASIFAIAVVKLAFGGLGCNWMNPALAGRVFVMFSFPGPMSTWILPQILTDAVSSATPLGAVKTGLHEMAVIYTDSASTILNQLKNVKGPMNYLALKAYSVSGFDTGITEWLGRTFGFSMPKGYFDLFVGNMGGAIGEVSALLLLLGSIYLFVKRIITWEIPVSYLASFSLLVWIFGGFGFKGGLFSGDVFFHLFTGGLILGVFYMATDMVTTPLTSMGMIIFGVGAGLLTFLIRFFGSLPEGVSLAIIIMNITVPLIDRYTNPFIFAKSYMGKNK